jgi:hypothetical protein
MTKIAGFLAVLTLAAAPAFAGIESYPQKLAELREVVSVDFDHSLPEFQKAEGVNALHGLVFSAAGRPYFGEGKLIDQVEITSWLASTATDAMVATKVAVRGSYVEFPVGAGVESARVLGGRLEQEQDVVGRIARVARDLKNAIPKLRIEREGEAVTKAPASNESHLAALEIFKEAVTSAKAAGELPFGAFKEVVFKDSTHSFDSTGFTVHEEDRSRELSVEVRVARHFGPAGPLLYSPAIARSVLTIVGAGFEGFSHASFSSMDSFRDPVATLEAGVSAIADYLTVDSAAFLRGKGVTGLVLVEKPEREAKLFEGGELKLGPTRASIEQIVELLFGT